MSRTCAGAPQQQTESTETMMMVANKHTRERLGGRTLRESRNGKQKTEKHNTLANVTKGECNIHDSTKIRRPRPKPQEKSSGQTA